MKHPSLHTKAEVVKDILETLDLDDKASLKDTPEDELSLLHHGWGTYLRNYDWMWHNEKLLQDIGAPHASGASGVIIREVWRRLQETEGN